MAKQYIELNKNNLCFSEFHENVRKKMSVRNTIARIFKYTLLASGVQLRRFRNATFFGQDMLSLLEYLFLCTYISS